MVEGDHGAMADRHRARTRQVTLVAYHDAQALDLVGPHEVFALANRFTLDPDAARTEVGPRPTGATRRHPGPAVAPYEIEVVACAAPPAEGPASVRTSSGLTIGVDRVVRPGRVVTRDRSIDTLMIVGGQGTIDAAQDRGLLGWVAAVAPGCRRVTAVCSGTFVLAAAGLLDGRRVTTHWSECDLLQRLYPTLHVEPDPIFVRDGHIATSAGITAGMDLALALVEEDLGREVALAVSRWLVMFVQRPGGQSQFSSQLAAQVADRAPLRELQAWIADNPDADCCVAALAGRVAMSPRHFARVFRDEVGVTPAQYVEDVRVELVRRLLETTDRSIEQIARDAGFGTVETLQRAFRRAVNITPTEYRRHFRRGGDAVAARRPSGEHAAPRRPHSRTGATAHA
jgi:transcriptional regulator GlxA family with amidase domain